MADELAALRRASEGERNDSLYRAALSLGRPVADGMLDRTQVEIDLRSVALDIGLSERETEATIRSGLEAGHA